ncbi:universal stress protein [Fulvivirga sp. 29W222]|uniref:Universal stress protein n=1 Tax=Fulvivirga marina TaxID=2494733 RepID=A0A937G5G1_9BACT|nr:universal stress protein [Fulvivirga marina]MBL6448766.1 universal stress protein [Fulvivirga marina]
MKRILVPVDFSDCANAAVEVALKIAKKAKMELFFLHLFPVRDSDPHVPGHANIYDKTPQDARHGQAKQHLSAIVLKAEALGLKATPVLVYNEGYDNIEDYIAPYDIDLVIMGSHGERAIKQAMLGSNTRSFIRHATAPVLVIKESLSDFSVRRIVFASSFEDDSVKSFEVVKQLAEVWKADIHLLYVNTPYHFKETHDSLIAIKTFMKQFPGVEYTPIIYNAFNEEEGIHRYANDYKMDLIAISTHGRKGFLKLLVHSVAETVAMDEDIPVLVINMKELNVKENVKDKKQKDVNFEFKL